MHKYSKNIILSISIAAFFILLFLGLHQVSISIAFLIIVSLVISFKNKTLKFNLNKSLLLLILFYLIHVIGVFYTKNKSASNFDLEVKLSLILFPLLFLFNKELFIKNYKLILNIFFYTSSFFAILLILRSLYIFSISFDSSKIFYTNFSIFLHPSYYSMYNVLAIIIGIKLFNIENKRTKILYAFLISFNIISVFFSQSKSGIISLVLIISYLLITYLNSISKRALYLSILSIIILGVLLINYNSRIKKMVKIISTYQKVLDKPNDDNYIESTGYRILSWNAALKVIKNNPIIGVGTGDIKDELFKEYKELNYLKNLNENMNVHNQVLETWLGQGFIGFSILLLLFIIAFINSRKRNNYLLQSYLIMLFLNLLFESILNTQAGTIFFGFFYPFLVLNEDNIIS